MVKKLLLIGLLVLVGCVDLELVEDFSLPSEKNGVGDLEVHFIDVGQGDSILVKGDSNVLVDCGKSGKPVVDYLKAENVGVIDTLVITHTDFDHLGGCDKVLDTFVVNKVVMDGQERDTKNYLEVVDRLEGREFVINPSFGYAVTSFMHVLHSNVGSDDPNMNSIVQMINFGSAKILLTGDCDRECEESLLVLDVDADVVQVPHHGSKYGTSNAFVSAVSPSVAVISVGKNSYGHPDAVVLNNLRDVDVFRTDVHGDVVVGVNGTDWWVE